MKTAQIVVIEDNSADVLLLEMALKAHGIAYELRRFRDGEEALQTLCSTEAIASSPGVPDLILLDLNTPKSDGFEVLKTLRQTPNLANVPLAVITSSQAKSDLHRTSLLGAIGYIEKPMQLEEFLSKVGLAVKEMLASQ